LLKKRICLSMILIIILVFLYSCDEGLLITHEEITTLPNKLNYAQYYDREPDFTGGQVTIYTKEGGTYVYPMAEVDTLKENANFNVPGIYKIFLDYTGKNTTFNIQVVPIAQADWLDGKIRNEIIKWSSIDTTQDQDSIKEMVNKFFESDLNILSQLTNDTLDKGINEIWNLLDQNSEITNNYIPALNKYYEDRIKNDYYGFHLKNIDNVFHSIYVQGNTAEVDAIEIGHYSEDNVQGNYTLQFKHALSLIKKDNVWYITKDVTNRFSVPMGLWS
jgi:hypothetical protein